GPSVGSWTRQAMAGAGRQGAARSSRDPIVGEPRRSGATGSSVVGSSGASSAPGPRVQSIAIPSPGARRRPGSGSGVAMRGHLFSVAALVLVSTAGLAPTPLLAEEINVLALGEGTLPVVEPPSFGSWPPVQVIDDAPSSGWACKDGSIRDNIFVFEMAAPATISTFEFDTAGIDGNGRGARGVLVEVSAKDQDSGFQPVLKATLADRADRQRFAAQSKVEGRFVRLTVVDNHGDPKWTELMGFR